MSEFGDKTPHQEILYSVEVVQKEYNLSDEEMVIILLKIISHYADPYENKSEELRKRRPAY